LITVDGPSIQFEEAMIRFGSLDLRAMTRERLRRHFGMELSFN